MAVEYTSIATVGGWSTNTVKPAWDLLFRTALNALPTCRQFVDVRPGRPTHTGDSITLQITSNYSEASITAAKAALNEELDVDPVKLPTTSTVTLTPVERGFTNKRTLKLANRSMIPVDPEIARALADHCAKVIDEVLQDNMVLGTQVYRGGGRASTVTVGATDTLTSDMIRLSATKLRKNQVMPQDGTSFIGLIHPNVVYDIRRETGSGGWRLPQEYGFGDMPSALYKGEFGEWEGVRWIQNARLRQANDGVTAGTVYRSFVLGREALAEAVVEEPGVKIGPVLDSLGRFRTVGWYGDWDTKIFRDLAIVRLETASLAV